MLNLDNLFDDEFVIIITKIICGSIIIISMLAITKLTN